MVFMGTNGKATTWRNSVSFINLAEILLLSYISFRKGATVYGHTANSIGREGYC